MSYDGQGTILGACRRTATASGSRNIWRLHEVTPMRQKRAKSKTRLFNRSRARFDLTFGLEGTGVIAPFFLDGSGRLEL
jgi:hypothetical protein